MDCRIIKNDKMKKNNSKKIYSLVFVLVSGWLQAQEFFEDDTLDVPASPINDWILPAMVFITVLMFVYLRKQQLK
jgi:hypothetical protein